MGRVYLGFVSPLRHACRQRVYPYTSRAIVLSRAIVISDRGGDVFFGDTGVSCPENPTETSFPETAWTAGVEKSS